DSLALRGISPHRLLISTVADDTVYGIDWVGLASSDGGGGERSGDPMANITVFRCAPTAVEGETVPGGTHRTLARVLERVQDWLSSDSHDDARLAVLTRRAIAVDSSEDVADLGQAAVWGLLRSAQTENPGRVLLADVDDWAGADVAVAEM